MSVRAANGRVVLSSTYDTAVAQSLRLNITASGIFVVAAHGQNDSWVLLFTKRIIK